MIWYYWVYIGIVILFSIAMIVEKISLKMDSRMSDDKQTND